MPSERRRSSTSTLSLVMEEQGLDLEVVEVQEVDLETSSTRVCHKCISREAVKKYTFPKLH